MLRVAISVEGKTEMEFVKGVLVPYLKNIQLTPINLEGNVSIERAVVDLRQFMYNFDWVTTLYDFYGFKFRKNRSIDELESALREALPRGARNFIPYIQQYEFEALLFSDPLIAGAALAIDPDILKSCGEPEKINDCPDTTPSQRLKKFSSSRYNKVVHGPSICKAIGLEKIMHECPRFKTWIQTLEALK